MGRRTGTETAVRLLVALLRRSTWSQSELARAAGVEARTARKHLEELQEAGVPLEREEEHPHVYWSVPRGWMPGGASLSPELAERLPRLIARLPQSQDRERILAALLKSGQHDGSAAPGNDRPDAVPSEIFATLEDAAVARIALRLTYFSASRGDRSARHVSLHRLLYGSQVRFVATCHRDDVLKVFRADRVERASLAPGERFRAPGADELASFLATSMGGFRAPGAAVRCAFRVRWPEARWVKDNLPESGAEMVVEHARDAVRFSCDTAAVEVLARFVVGLGATAEAETPELRRHVIDLARGALAAHEAPRANLSGRSVSVNRQTG